MTANWPIGDPVYEPLCRNLITATSRLLAWYQTYTAGGITKLEETANEEANT